MNQIRSASLLASFTIALAVGVPAPAQTIPPDAYGALRWRLIGPHRGGRVLAVAGVPGDAATFYFGAVDGGVWRTRNAGVTWEPLFDDQPIASIGALALAPSDPNVIYVGTGEASIRSDITYGAGVYKSTDGGAHWHALGLTETRHIGKVLVDARNPDVVLVAALGHAYGPNPERGVFRSADGGRNWYFCRVTVDPQNPDVVYVPNVSLLRSSDGGKAFTVLKGQPGGDDYHELWVDPRGPTRMIVGSDQGAVITLDDGRTWSSWYNQPTAQFYHVVTDDAFPYRVYGAQQDAGTAGVTSRTDLGEITFRDWAPVGAGESGYIAPDPLDSDIVYGGDTYGGVHRFDRRTGQSQDISPWPVSTFGVPMPQRKYRFTWTSPLVFDRVDRHALYLGAQMVLRTRDGGLHWEAISPDLTRAGATTVANAAGRGYGVVYAIAPSPRAAGLLWVGTDDGLIHRTRDAGRAAHWQNVTPQGLEPWSTISVLEASPFDTAVAYAAVDRHRVDEIGRAHV